MSVVGIDFGAQSTKIGVARNKGIDIVRITPIYYLPYPRVPFFYLGRWASPLGEGPHRFLLAHRG